MAERGKTYDCAEVQSSLESSSVLERYEDQAPTMMGSRTGAPPFVAAEDERLRRFSEKLRLARGQGSCRANGSDAATLIPSSCKPPELAVVVDRHLEAVPRQPPVERADEAAGVARRNAIVVVVEVGQSQGIASRTTAT